MPELVPVRPTATRQPNHRLTGLLSFLRRQRDAGPRHWLVVGAWTLAGLVGIAAVDVIAGTPSPTEIRGLVNMASATRVVDINDREVFTIFKERRIPVALKDVSPHVQQAVLAIEDQRFYAHGGLDFWRIGGAAVANAKGSGRLQGGSTITQQLARKSFLTDERTIRRKLKEMFLALRVERQFTKDEILELYLNKVYFGNGLYGIEAASRGYFGKSASELSIDEAALLAGLIQAPSAYDPTERPQKALARREIVLRAMADAGFIKSEDIPRLQATTLKLVDGFGHEQTGQYFKNHITRLLIEQFGWEQVSQGGLRVYATIDGRAQKAAEAAVAKGLEEAEKLKSFKHARRGDARVRKDARGPDYLQGALVAIDPASGEVRAMVGGREFDESQFNRALQAKRQAGSAFKPFVFAAAIENGASPGTLLTDLDTPMEAADGMWRPADAHLVSESMTVRTALRTSSNRAAVQVLRDVGIPRAVSFAARLGIEAPSVPSMVLGSGDVTALSMATAYGVFANGGFVRSPVFIRRVEDAHGRVIYSGQATARPAVSPETAFLMAQMLADALNSGTGYRARQAGFKYAAGGKTGTTNDYKDAWFVGFTPSLVTAVWVGFDQPRTIVPGGYAGQLAAPIWGRFMKDAVTKDAGWIKRPSGIEAVEICRASGKLPTDGCYRGEVNDDGEIKATVGTEYFRRGTEPTETCPIHGSVGFWQRLFGGGR
jgi:penicillin-binding protein 1A